MQQIQFTKMSGTGNDFILIDHRNPFIAQSELTDFARAVCRRKFSVGADGLILIEPSSKADFSWTFMNADGSVAEMCGNGARCAARFAYENKIAPAQMSFETLAGIIQAEIVNDSVKLRMTAPTALAFDQKLIVDDAEILVHSLNTGVPHAVHFNGDLDNLPVVTLGRAVRHHEIYQPAGSNVNFAKVLSDRKLHVRTYERGVEDETMACGTGAVASAIIAGILGHVKPPVSVVTSGGELLRIHFKLHCGDRSYPEVSHDDISDVYLEGPAHIIYQGWLHEDALLNNKN